MKLSEFFPRERMVVQIFLLLILFTCVVVPLPGNAQGKELKKGSISQVSGFHLDLRIQVLKPAALYRLADELAGFGFNTLVMEWEGTFPYSGHPLIPNRYAYTKEEISGFVAYCEGLGIEVIPLQQSFGHVEYILRHYRYADLREDQKDVSQVCPLEKDLNRRLFTELFTEMASLHPSRYFHIGGDETYLLGECDRCHAFAEAHGKSLLYVEHIKMMCEIVTGLGKRPVLWADIALKYPEELDQLPEETVFIDWNYGWKLDHFGDVEKLAQSGFEVWGAPSLRSSPDNYYLTTWEKHFGNFEDFIPAARDLGYTGMVLTSWSTSGRYSPVYESRWKILDLVPIRRVYPLSGFRISIAAFTEAMKNAPFDLMGFLNRYCEDRFGFDAAETGTFWSALTMTPYQADNGSVLYKDTWSISMLHDSTEKAVGMLSSLVPERNHEEFGHFLLMMDIRMNYLAYKELEAMVNAPSFLPEQVPGVLAQLERIIKTGALIDSRFMALNKNDYYLSELGAENYNRNSPAIMLYERLSRQR